MFRCCFWWILGRLDQLFVSFQARATGQKYYYYHGMGIIDGSKNHGGFFFQSPSVEVIIIVVPMIGCVDVQ